VQASVYGLITDEVGENVAVTKTGEYCTIVSGNEAELLW